MKNKIKNAFCFLLMCFLLQGVNNTSFSQELEKVISSKLSSGDRKKMEKAIEMNQKGLLMEQEASRELSQTTIKSELDQKKADKKYALKRMAVSEIYANASELKFDLLKTSAKNFWKTYKGDKQSLTMLKSFELLAMDSLKRGFNERKKAEKIIKTTERLELTLSAEERLNKFVVIFEKVVYSYENWPNNFDPKWYLASENTLPDANTPQQENPIIPKDTLQVDKTIPSAVSTDTAATLPPAIIAVQDTLPLNRGVVKPEKDESDTSRAELNQPEKTITVPEVVVTATPTKPTSISRADVKMDSIAQPPVNYQANDSSLYGKVKINEEEVDQFNGFLKKKFPDKYEDFVINFQNLDYSDVESLKKSWYNYRYGSVPGDSGMTLASLRKQKRDTSSSMFTVNTDSEHAGSTIGQQIRKQAKNKTDNFTSGNMPSDAERKGMMHDSVSSDFIFHVQIVACRTKLNMKTVKAMCQCNDSIMEFYEDNWYKYAIGKYNSYREARQMRDAMKISGVFVIAYLHGKRIKISPAIAYKKKNAGNVKTKN